MKELPLAYRERMMDLLGEDFAAYEAALAAGFRSKSAPKVVPLQSQPYRTSIHIAFVYGPDGEEVEFFREV